nr:hypothetical protein [uncultured bacterium]
MTSLPGCMREVTDCGLSFLTPLFVHFRADDDVTARLYARGYRLRPEFFK